MNPAKDNLDFIGERWSDPRASRYSAIGDGWVEIVREMIARLDAISTDYKVAQVKEKFGVLRVYIDTPEDTQEIMNEPVRMAELASMETCEVCGEPGQLSRDLRWVKTVCETHHQEFAKREAEHFS